MSLSGHVKHPGWHYGLPGAPGSKGQLLSPALMGTDILQPSLAWLHFTEKVPSCAYFLTAAAVVVAAVGQLEAT